MNAIVKSELTPANRQELIKVLGSSLYPGASVQSIEMVLGYCEAAGLDPLQKPVHIVPMYDPKARQMRDVIMPGVNLYRINAMRTGECAGISEPEFGQTITKNLGGEMIEFPEWAKVVVKRVLPNGLVAEFVGKELWLENYATKGGPDKSVAPNQMWRKRVYGQLAKCAESQALRKAFPEHNSAPTAEEMEGKPLDPNLDIGNVIDVDGRPQELVAAARAAADQGTESYRQWWHGITHQQRTLMQSDHAAFKVRAQAADAKRKQAVQVEALATPPDESPPPSAPVEEPPPAEPPVEDEFLAGFEAEESRQVGAQTTTRSKK